MAEEEVVDENWFTGEGAELKHDPRAFSHCKDWCKVRLAKPHDALTPQSLTSVVD